MEQTRNILFIINPVAKHGEAAKASSIIDTVLKMHETSQEKCSPTVSYKIVESERPRHAIEIARDAYDFDTVVAVGGDGTVHEVVNGLMEHAEDDRPTFGLVAIGSGNDFHRSLHTSLSVERAILDLLHGIRRRIDVGICNGEWFAETFSLGIDAVVASRATELAATTRWSGTPLYARAALEIIVSHFSTSRISYSIDGSVPTEQDVLIFACNNGRTYGGGFPIAPHASLTDGRLNICMASEVKKRLLAVYYLMQILTGRHESLDAVHTCLAKHIEIRSQTPILAQLDGEPKAETYYDISIIENALEVVLPVDSPVLG